MFLVSDVVAVEYGIDAVLVGSNDCIVVGFNNVLCEIADFDDCCCGVDDFERDGVLSSSDVTDNDGNAVFEESDNISVVDVVG